jgi:hypothetical protein
VAEVNETPEAVGDGSETVTLADDGFVEVTKDRLRRVETWAAILMAITTILTAWSAFQSAKWSGAMSIEFSKANTDRNLASREAASSGQLGIVQVGLFEEWLLAKANGEDTLADYLESQFPESFRPAFDSWLALASPGEVPSDSPFDQPNYELPNQQEVDRLDLQAEGHFRQALANNQRGDNYTLLTVLFASVLFFAGISGRFESHWATNFLLGMAGVTFLVGVVFVFVFPKLV